MKSLLFIINSRKHILEIFGAVFVLMIFSIYYKNPAWADIYGPGPTIANQSQQDVLNQISRCCDTIYR